MVWTGMKKIVKTNNAFNGVVAAKKRETRPRGYILQYNNVSASNGGG